MNNHLILVGDEGQSKKKSINSFRFSLNLSIPIHPGSPFSQRTLLALQLKSISFQYQVSSSLLHHQSITHYFHPFNHPSSQSDQEATDTQKALDANASNPTQYLPFLIYDQTIITGGSVNLIQFLEEGQSSLPSSANLLDSILSLIISTSSAFIFCFSLSILSTSLTLFRSRSTISSKTLV